MHNSAFHRSRDTAGLDGGTLPHKRRRVGWGPTATVQIDVSLNQVDWRAKFPDVEALVKTAALAALADAAPRGEAPLIVGIILTDDEEQRQLNRIYRDKDAATNVLSFALTEAGAGDPHPALPRLRGRAKRERAAMPLLLGDVVLAYETLAREAAEQQKPLAHHLQHLVVHGVLHLLGFDHENDTEAAIMEAREIAILTKLGVPDPYRDIM